MSLEDLQQQLSNIIKTQCNPIGCDNCGLKFGGYDSKHCAATDLDGRIMDIMMQPYNTPENTK